MIPTTPAETNSLFRFETETRTCERCGGYGKVVGYDGFGADVEIAARDCKECNSTGRIPTPQPKGQPMNTEDRYLEQARELFDGTIIVAEKLIEAGDFNSVVPAQVQFLANELRRRDAERDAKAKADACNELITWTDPHGELMLCASDINAIKKYCEVQFTTLRTEVDTKGAEG